MNQEEDSADYQIYPASLPRQEKSDEFIDENTEEEDIQSLESLNTSYRDYRRQDEETVHPLLSELDEQLIGAKYFTEQDVCWGYDNEHIKDEDKWEMAKTNQILFEPTVIFSSSYYSPTTSQTNMDEIFLDQKNEHRIDIDDDPETKEQNTEYTRSVPRRSRDNDLSTEPEGYTSWVTRTEYEGLPNPENQLLANPMKLYGIDKWPTPAMTTEVKSFLGFGNVDKGLIQDDWTLTEPFEVLLEMDETFLAKKDEQDNKDMIMLPEGLFPNSLDYGFDDERTLEIDDGQSDPIQSLSVHGLKTLRNHFSKVTAATSVNDIIAVNITNTNLQKWIMMAQDMDITVNDAVNILLGKRDGLRDWLAWILRSPNKNTASTDRRTLQFSKTIQIFNGKQTPTTRIKPAGNEDSREIWAQNVFDMPMEGILLSLNLQTTRKRNNLLFYIMAFNFGITPEPLFMNLLESLTSDMVMEDHGSTRGVILGISEPYNDRTTTILLGTLSKQYELSDKLVSDRRAHSVLHKSGQLFGFKLTTNRPHYPWKEGTTKHIISETWKLLFPTLYYNKKPHTTQKTAQQKLKKQAPKQGRPFIRHQNSTFPIIHHHNMFLRKTKSTPIFKTSSILDDENE